MFRKKLKEIQKELPRQGGPGRGGSLSATEKVEVCEQISTLVKLVKIKKLADIYQAVSHTIELTMGKKVSAGTIKRVWENRGTLYVG